VLVFDDISTDEPALLIHKGSTAAGADRSPAGRLPFVRSGSELVFSTRAGA
jgi:hypothetical protein